MAESTRKINLLILTQKVDINDPILGFFHRWIEEFAKHCSKLTVICLQQGEYKLPQNVKVLSLGKEGGESKIKYLLKFYKYIWQERKNYDAVFVHMNQEYVVLGGLIWRIWGKKVAMWRNHPKSSVWAYLAVFLSNKAFCTSNESFTARFKKTTIMPVGIDTSFFERKSDIVKKPNSILFLGRISPIKKPDLFIEALNLLNRDKVDFIALIVGDPLPKDADYYKELKNLVKKYNLENKIIFEKGIINKETVNHYNMYDVYVNATTSGSLDKTIFEAMASETLVLTSNKSVRGRVPPGLLFNENDIIDLKDRLKNILETEKSKKENIARELREFVIKNHSLVLLSEKLMGFLTKS